MASIAFLGWGAVQTVLREHLTVTPPWRLAVSAEHIVEEQMTWQLSAETLGWVITFLVWRRERGGRWGAGVEGQNGTITAVDRMR